MSCADVPRGRWLLGGGGRFAEVETTLLRQAVEELRLEMASLVSRDFCGYPKRAIQPESRARDTAVMSGMGKASGQRVKRSTAVRQ